MSFKSDTSENYDENEESTSEEEEWEVEELRDEQLTQMEGVLLSAVLREAFLQVNVFNPQYLQPSLTFQDIKERFVKPIKSTVFDPETCERMDFSLQDRAEKKMKRDKSLLVKVLSLIAEEAEERLGWGLAASVLTLCRRRERAEVTLEREYWAKRAKIHHMRNIIEDTKRHKRRLARDKVLVAEAQLDKLQEENQKGALEFQYVKRYEEVRVEQNQLVCRREERELRHAVAAVNEKTEDEERVHQATIAYLQYAIKRLDEKVDFWTAKYNRDIEDKDVEIQNLKQRRTEGMETIQELHDLYKERELEISQFVAVLAEKERKEEAARLREAMAIKIQAWWRGVLVRAQLGPFRYLRKEKKKKKAKK